MPTGDSSSGGIRVFCPHDDAEAAEECCRTVALAMAPDAFNVALSSSPDHLYTRFHGLVNNILLADGAQPILHTLADGSYDAVAIAYLYPSQKGPDGQLDPPGLLDLTPLTHPEALTLSREFFAHLDEGKEEFSKSHPSFVYVAFLAVRPGSQGRGLGSRLLAHLGQMADDRGEWAYLDASTPGSKALYERHGFRVLHHRRWEAPWLEEAQGLDLNIWRMARPPQAMAAQ